MIIDDGSHLPEHQWTTIEALWRTIKPGGVYIIEVGAGPGLLAAHAAWRSRWVRAPCHHAAC